jgi:hypothetical protein
MVRKFVSAALLSMSLMSLPVMVGCDRKVASEEKVTTGPNGTKVEKSKTVEKPNGTVEKTTEKHTENP